MTDAGRDASVGRVTSYISHTTVDSRDAYAQSVWWCGVLDYREDPDDPNLPGHEECMIFSADGSHPRSSADGQCAPSATRSARYPSLSTRTGV